MATEIHLPSIGRQTRVCVSFLLALLMTVVAVEALAAEDIQADPPNLDNSSKEVDATQALPGEILAYTIVVTNSGGSPAPVVVVTDELPAGLGYQQGSLSVIGGGLFGESNNVITWTGAVNNGTAIRITFGAVLSESVEVGGSITNTVLITGTGESILRHAVTEIVSDTRSYVYLPLVSKPPEPPILEAISYASGSTDWTVAWSDSGPDVIKFELQESVTADFGSVVTYDAGTSTSQLISHDPLTSNTYYYRVRVLINGLYSRWSESQVLLIPAPSAPTLKSIVDPSGDNQWTVSWDDSGSGLVGYELQESRTASFSPADTYDLGISTSKLFEHDPSNRNTYYYRVRVNRIGLLSDWSNVESVVGDYHDSFDDPSSGWAIRQQDMDDTDNSSWYQDGSFVLEIHGRWDYAIAAPLAPAPRLPYEIKTVVRLETPDNLHSTGIIFGGDWNGGACTVQTIGEGNCLNHYYRLNIVWYSGSAFKVNLKRIDYHDANNQGRGVTLIDFMTVTVGDSRGWNTWSVEVNGSGLIQVYANGVLAAQATDTKYIHDPYFGVFASSNEYLGARPFFDWYKATAMD